LGFGVEVGELGVADYGWKYLARLLYRRELYHFAFHIQEVKRAMRGDCVLIVYFKEECLRIYDEIS